MRDLTLRTPTLDDVFLELTGSHIEHDEADTRSDDAEDAAEVTTSRRPSVADRSPTPTLRATARPGFVHDVAPIAGRALRAVPRDLESGDPAGVHRRCSSSS